MIASKRSLAPGEPSPDITFNKCCACNPSLPLDVPFRERLNAIENIVNVKHKGNFNKHDV
ncbi:hypothetical protein A2U01_0001206, partial [Trifolium medium]|nr:hypothetical protein [Trifolium medium]